MVGPARKREVVAHVCQRLEASERRACRTLGQARSSQRDRAKPKEDDARLTAAIRRIAAREPRAGYRGVRRHLVREGWDGCTGSGKRKDSGCRRRPARSAAWATRKTEHNACKPSGDGIEILDELVARRGVPEFIRSDNGPEFVANAVKDWIAEKGVQNPLHRTGLTLAELLQRELQREVSRRVPQRGKFCEPAGSQGAGRRAPEQIQPPPSALLSGRPDARRVRGRLPEQPLRFGT